jgi:hypothetical protein
LSRGREKARRTAEGSPSRRGGENEEGKKRGEQHNGESLLGARGRDGPSSDLYGNERSLKGVS